jgi:hypothetical protein
MLSHSLFLSASLIHSLSVCYRALFTGACTRGVVNMSSLYTYFLYTCFRCKPFPVKSSSFVIIVRRIFIQQLLVIIKHSQLSVLEPIACLSCTSWYKMHKIFTSGTRIFFLCALDPDLDSVNSVKCERFKMSPGKIIKAFLQKN